MEIDPQIEALARRIRPLLQPIGKIEVVAMACIAVTVTVGLIVLLIWVAKPLSCRLEPPHGPTRRI